MNPDFISGCFSSTSLILASIFSRVRLESRLLWSTPEMTSLEGAPRPSPALGTDSLILSGFRGSNRVPPISSAFLPLPLPRPRGFLAPSVVMEAGPAMAGPSSGRILGLPLGRGGPSRFALVGLRPRRRGPSGPGLGGQKSISPSGERAGLERQLDTRSGRRLGFRRISAGTSALSSSASNSYSCAYSFLGVWKGGSRRRNR